MDERYQTVVVLVHVWVDINKERVLRLGQRSGVCVSRQIFSVVVRYVRCTASAPPQLSLVPISALCFGSWIYRIDVGHWNFFLFCFRFMRKHDHFRT